jgi:hypothetical protein
MKIVPFYSNTSDNLHCLQSCIKSILNFYLPNKRFSDQEIDEATFNTKGWSWIAPSVNWLDDLGFKVKFFCPPSFSYFEFISKGDEYMEKFKGKAVYEYEKQNGSYEDISFIQKSAELMIKRKLLEQRILSNSDLAQLLKNEQVLAIGKTAHEWLSGNYPPLEELHSHYVLIIKEYSSEKWKVHDPGLPPVSERKVNKTIHNHNIFGDILVIYGLK